MKRISHQSRSQQTNNPATDSAALDTQLSLGKKEQLLFDDLKLAVGERVKLESVSQRGRYTVRYLGAYPGRCLMVSAPVHNGVMVSLKEGSAVRLRLIALNRACAFSCRVLKVISSPVSMLLLEHPGEIETVRVRKSPRVTSQLIISVDEAESGQFGSGWPRQALCGDISLQGARIEAGDQLGEVGDRLYVTSRVQVGTVEQVMMIEAVIRNLEEIEDSFSGGFRMVHGVEFTGLDEEGLLILTGFVYQQMLQEQVGL
ncbi:MAG: flagellar brake protein [Motiliproteus sp.]